MDYGATKTYLQTVPSFLSWGNGVQSKLEFISGNWVVYDLPDDKFKLFFIPRINNQEIDLPIEQFLLLNKMILE